MKIARLLCSVLVPVAAAAASAEVLDKRSMLGNQSFWANQDFDWYEENIPFFESPDEEINTTYYYRWELVTRHFVYGNPNFGYAFTEFANRPFWSGAYGTISCPAGHQIYEARWLHEPKYVRDYLRFWMRHPGAEPRNYSFWAADSAWATHQVHPNEEFVVDLLPDLIENYEAWKDRQWVEEMGLFWQLGHDDGMEFDINAQQTQDILRGGESLRPSFNAYMWADARALAKIAGLKGDDRTAGRFLERAEQIRTQVEANLWDPERQFFFPMSNERHEKDGHVVEKHTLTYETGEFAGSPHGRELHGYVPWAFNMPEPGFEDAWRFLMDEEYFWAPYGPTTVERNDPLFVLQDGCCWWSGQSWPFATTQTLKAMANLLQNYEQDHVDREDYAELLHTYAITHRKDGEPYIAEAVHPFTGSWEGHDFRNRSEHYFHSGFTDLVITGLAGVQPSNGDTLTLDPLAPDDWDYFALDNLPYRGHVLTVFWDRTGERYGAGPGLHVLVNGEPAGSAPELGEMTVELPPARQVPVEENPPMNYAVNNDGDYYPRYRASFVNPDTALADLSDGQYRYDTPPANRWTTAGSPDDEDWVEVDLGTGRTINEVRLYVIDDGEGAEVRAPEEIELAYWDDSAWREVPEVETSPESPAGGRPFTLRFPTLNTERLRAEFRHAGGARSGLTEFEAWGPGERPYTPAPPPEGNIAYNDDGEGFPKATASHSDQYGGIPRNAIDGRIVFEANPVNRWTSYGSPDNEDWLEIEFAEEREVGRVVLHMYDDGGGVQAPESYTVEAWTGSEWREVPEQAREPASPTGNMANTAIFPGVSTKRVRVVFTHAGEARSGVTELELWKE